ncbi:hypothetical protein PQJ75_00800 [Rhodoplanes sp. TEM]|uniref:Methyltransferase domain-containing protein n=1 Tax=Rhodoplanes tepidamans TaxID=200616 RepID=A0ABT5J5X4_RHOTP|nr:MULTISPECIES: hypothetical protein [Rhodoplanes]MDC7784791.1 hypothetical protein [Rhodoplanes tepidamans]MDC7982258.1 hypothetical protein [Rhodoplanes sp. TEM]MDQ0356265.1 putative TPR repeat methyltransferase [Rhodoplanes tepidamans]
MRFDDPGYLAAWRAGRYPRIHDAIFEMAVVYMRGTRVLDLGCSYGLIGDRLVRNGMAEFVVGVDADEAVLAQGRDAGVSGTLYSLRVTEETLPELIELVSSRRLDVLVARRVLPELFGENVQLGRRFAHELRAAGIREVFVEGRVASVRSVNALRSIDEEVDLLSEAYREARRIGAVSFMQAR